MKTCLITGASGGVARALAKILKEEGWRLVLVSRDVEALDGLMGDLALAANVGSEAGAQAAIAACIEATGGVPDAVVNAAGDITIASIQRTSEAQYRACLAANLDTAFFISKAYVTALQSHKQPGSLLLFSSVAASIGVANHAAVAMAKGAVEALVRSLAADHSAAGLRVNAIAPGLMRTPLSERLLASEAAARQVAAQYPLGRHGEAEDAAALAAFLLSDRASWITGQVIGLDGGFSAVRPYVRAA